MNNTSYKNFEELPLTLSVTDIGKIWGISRTGAYSLFNRDDFPKIVIGSRKIIAKEKFLNWLE